MPNVIVDADKLAALITDVSVTSKVRTLRDAIGEYADSPAMDWNDDLKAIGIIVNDQKAADALKTAFGTVASEVTGKKMSAKLRWFKTGEVAVTFRNVNKRNA